MSTEQDDDKHFGEQRLKFVELKFLQGTSSTCKNNWHHHGAEYYLMKILV